MDNVLATKIEEIFSNFGLEDQHKMLARLKSQTKSSGIIKKFCDDIQKRFGQNVEFFISQDGPAHAPRVIISLVTPFGTFHGEGINQSIARANACENAKKAWPKFSKPVDLKQ